MFYRDVLYAIPSLPEPGNSVTLFCRRKPVRFLGYAGVESEILSTCTKRNLRRMEKKNVGPFAVSLWNAFIAVGCFY